jgi:hypothetical protein
MAKSSCRFIATCANHKIEKKKKEKTLKFWMPLVYIVPSLVKATALHATNYYILGLGFKSSDLLSWIIQEDYLL